MATGDLTTLADVKSHDGGFDDASRDTEIQRLITDESARFCTTLTHNPIFKAAYVETFSGRHQDRLPFKYDPVDTSTIVLTVDGVTVPQRPDLTSNGWILIDGRIELVGYCFTCGKGNVTLAYSAGYDTVPLDVAQAVVEMVLLKLGGSRRIGVMTQTLAGETSTFQSKIPDSVQSVVNAYWRPA